VHGEEGIAGVIFAAEGELELQPFQSGVEVFQLLAELDLKGGVPQGDEFIEVKGFLLEPLPPDNQLLLPCQGAQGVLGPLSVLPEGGVGRFPFPPGYLFFSSGDVKDAP